MSGGALVLGEVRGGRLARASAEAVTVARRLVGPAGSGTVTGLVLAGAPAAAASELARTGVDRVLAVSDPTFDAFHASRTAAVAAAVATERSAAHVVVGGTAAGRELVGRLAARWDAAAVTGVVDLVPDGDRGFRAVRTVFSGRAFEEVRLEGPRAVWGTHPLAFAAPPPGPEAPVEARAISGGPSPVPGTAVGFEAASNASGPDLAEATVVVSGGRGLRAPENFHLVEELAGALGGAVGASRAVTDAGWRPTSYQVGQTGRTVTPQLYVAVGISGAIQHLVGMVGSRTIVAINSDPNAPIFKVADYGVVGDLFQIVPALTAEVRKVRGA